MKYKVGNQMPCLSIGHKPDDQTLLWPDFSQDINTAPNWLLQIHAAMLVLEQERDHPGNVPKQYQEKWVMSAVLMELAHATWPHLKQVFLNQHNAEKDGGREQRKKKSLHMTQMCGAITDFCIKHNLDHIALPATLVYDDWVWEWYQSVHTRYMRKVAVNGKPGCRAGKHINLGHTSSLMLKVKPFNSMLDSNWLQTDLPRCPDCIHHPGLPAGLSLGIMQLIRPSIEPMM
ncbi:hypothetical protein DACRYDRAFT_16686 [Dacryopinax primogenitus]|uniref:Uncharacterized protein n=1 Tax=Dacryopinax primogenitus (strain DJM 731) TaxID=1858805 RepID=M5FY73_DACPD|nr:uncharacterized protein DACRYDRAFT_16686 [Dacryopinax primogenitus]EJU00755.1 hypothetical protein DACRYDRAFT_16686 [Dacryopinax primogenitus]